MEWKSRSRRKELWRKERRVNYDIYVKTPQEGASDGAQQGLERREVAVRVSWIP